MSTVNHQSTHIDTITNAGPLATWVALALAASGHVLTAAKLARTLRADRHAIARALSVAESAGWVIRAHHRGWHASGALSTIQPPLFLASGVLSTTHNQSVKPSGAYSTTRGVSGAISTTHAPKKEKEEEIINIDLRSRISQLYKSEIGPMTEAIQRRLHAATIRQPNLAAWEHAFDAAAAANVRKWSYVEKCAMRYGPDRTGGIIAKMPIAR